MNEEEALELGRALREEGVESHGHLTLREPVPEFDGGYSLRLKTKNRTLTPALMGLLNSQDVSLTYVGEADVMEFNAEWIVEPVN